LILIKLIYKKEHKILWVINNSKVYRIHLTKELTNKWIIIKYFKHSQRKNRIIHQIKKLN